MRRHVFACLGAVSLGLLIGGAALSACSMGDEDHIGGFAPDSHNNPGVGNAAAGTGSGEPWAGDGEGITGEAPQNPPPPPAEGEDAGTDADAEPAFTCEGLDQEKPVVLYLSADDSNSMASPVFAREMIMGGAIPEPNRIRTYEFLNYYRIAYPAAPPGQLSIIPQMQNTAVTGELSFQIGVRSFDAPKPRRAMTITFVLDTSGSMGGPAIERERAAAKAITASLASGDIVNMVTWNTQNNVILSGHTVAGPNDATVLNAINALEADGGTDLHSGLVAGYKLAQDNYGPQRMNRLILISDGGANVGITDADFIGKNSEDADKEGIYLVGIGAGPASGYNDALMDVVTDKGRGAYIYLDEPAEAERMFVDRFDETMEVAARSVQVEVTLPWYFRIEKFYGEEYSENAQEIEPQHLAPSDAMIFNQIVKACDPAVIKDADPITVKATWKTPLTYMLQETLVTMTVSELLAGGKDQLKKGEAIVAYAEALKTPNDPEAAQKALAIINAANPGKTDPELNEIAKLLEMHPSF